MSDQVVEWYFYADGECLGTVYETTEDNARCAGLCQFDVSEDAAISVMRAKP